MRAFLGEERLDYVVDVGSVLVGSLLHHAVGRVRLDERRRHGVDQDTFRRMDLGGAPVKFSSAASATL